MELPKYHSVCFQISTSQATPILIFFIYLPLSNETLMIMKAFRYFTMAAALVFAALSCTPEGYEDGADPYASRELLKVKSINVTEHSSSSFHIPTTGTVEFTWDSKGRLVKEVTTRNSLVSPESFTYNYVYDDANRTCTVKRADLENYEIFRFDRKGYLIQTEDYDAAGKPTLGLHRVIKDGKVVAESISTFNSDKGKWMDYMTSKYEWNEDRDITREVAPDENFISPDVTLYNKDYTYTEDGKVLKIPFKLDRDFMLYSSHFECPAMLPYHTVQSIAEDGGIKKRESYLWEYDAQGRPSKLQITQHNGAEDGYYSVIEFNY